jgi:hypothetical protein
MPRPPRADEAGGSIRGGFGGGAFRAFGATLKLERMVPPTFYRMASERGQPLLG